MSIHRTSTDPIVGTIDDLLETAARLWQAFDRNLPDGAHYASSDNPFLGAAEAAWNRAAEADE